MNTEMDSTNLLCHQGEQNDFLRHKKRHPVCPVPLKGGNGMKKMVTGKAGVWFAVSGGYNVFLNNRRSSEHLFGSDQFDSATGGFFFNSGGETAFAEKIIILFRDLCQNA